MTKKNTKNTIFFLSRANNFFLMAEAAERTCEYRASLSFLAQIGVKMSCELLGIKTQQLLTSQAKTQ